MDLTFLEQLNAQKHFIYFLGIVALMITPPVVGMTIWLALFGSPIKSITDMLKRFIFSIMAGLGSALFLGFIGVTLLQSAPPDMFITLMGFCFLLGLILLGGLYTD